MRIPIATTIVCSTLSTLAFYQGFVALLAGPAHPDEDESPSANNDKATKAAQTTTQTKPAIAAPEGLTMASTPTVRVQAGSGKQTAQSVASQSSTAVRPLPTVEIPPAPARYASTIEALSGSSAQTASTIAAPETIATGQTNSAQPLPFAAATVPLADVKGHWAESYIEALADKGIVRGYRDGKFHPDEPVTPTQFARMTQQAFAAAPISYSDLQQHTSGAPTRADAAAFIAQTIARTESAPTVTAVQISGAVPRPGIYTLPEGNNATSTIEQGLPTVTRAIQRAGGVLAGADLRQVQIHRVSDTTARQVINVDVQQMLQTGDRSRDFVLKQGDRLFIPVASEAASQPLPNTLPTTTQAVSLLESK